MTIPFSDYAALDAVNWSTLKEMRRSPRHYLHRLTSPKADTAAMKKGRATHCAVFEPDRFPLDFVVWEGDRRGKAFAAFAEQHPDQTILTRVEYDTCLAMRDAVRSHPIAGPLLTPPGEAEKVITWTDEVTGLACKARIDWWRVGLLADLKTSARIDARRFAATVFDMGYHGQAAFYRAGLIANGLDASPFRIVAVESAAPHDVAVFPLDDDALYQGELLVSDLLARVSVSRFTGKWPGAYPEEVPLSLPAWAFPKEEGALDVLGLEAPDTEAA